jgi:hypothetical protein
MKRPDSTTATDYVEEPTTDNRPTSTNSTNIDIIRNSR